MAKAANFNINSLLNTESLKQSSSSTRKKINYKQLIGHEKNHYSIVGISELADAIEDVGLLQDIVVKKTGEFNSDGQPLYKIVSGHRRQLAIKELVENRGQTKYSEIPCVVISQEEDELITQLKLHLANTTARELSEYDKMIAISELKKIIENAKEKGIKIKGRVREIISENVNLGATQVQKYLDIAEKATDEVRSSLQSGDITVQEAYNSIKKSDEYSDGAQPKEKNKSSENSYKKLYSKFKAFKKLSQDMQIQDEEFLKLIEELENYINAKNSDD